VDKVGLERSFDSGVEAPPALRMTAVKGRRSGLLRMTTVKGAEANRSGIVGISVSP
jgi:hypothetical protein